MLALRKPNVNDVDAMHQMMVPHVISENLLPRSPRQIVENLRDYVIAEEDGRLVGLASLSLVECHLAELGAVVCEKPALLERLVKVALAEAQVVGVHRVFVLAPEAAPYEALGFSKVAIQSLPEKRDRQCLRCPRLPRCRQVALEYSLEGSPKS
jgi:amino-acid N-acetyltransferase